jgi:hypothetical protein
MVVYQAPELPGPDDDRERHVNGQTQRAERSRDALHKTMKSGQAQRAERSRDTLHKSGQAQRAERSRDTLHKTGKNGHLTTTQYYRMRLQQRITQNKLKERYVNSVFARPGKRSRNRHSETTPPPGKRAKIIWEEDHNAATDVSGSQEHGIVSNY